MSDKAFLPAQNLCQTFLPVLNTVFYKLTVHCLCPLSFPSGSIFLLGTHQPSQALTPFLTENKVTRDLK